MKQDRRIDTTPLLAAPEFLERLPGCRVRLTRAYEWAVPAGKVTAEHTEGFAKVIHLVGGSLRYVLDGVEVPLHEGEGMYRPAWSRARWTAEAETLLCLCEFDIDPIVVPRLEDRVASLGEDARVQTDAMRRISRMHWSGSATTAALIEAELKAVVARLLTASAAATRTTAAPAESGQLSDAERAVIRSAAWLARHFEQADALDAMYAQSGVSPNHFRLLFHRLLKQSPRHRLTELRLQHACWYLKASTLSIKQVAAASGFSSARIFSRIFQEHYGSTPSNYRSQHAGGTDCLPRP